VPHEEKQSKDEKPRKGKGKSVEELGKESSHSTSRGKVILQIQSKISQKERHGNPPYQKENHDE